MKRLSQIKRSFCNESKKKFLFLFGPPGAGKGTYAKMLKKDLKLNHISTGDEIRKILKNNQESKFTSTLKQQIRSIVQKGELVSDQIVIQIIKQKVHDPESQHGVILDGFPRTKNQLKAFLNEFPLDAVFNITVKKDVLIEKLLGRRMCNKCGASFNVCDIQRDGYSMDPMLPRKPGICDLCGGQLISRADDTFSTISFRMEEYEEKTKPLIDQFKQMKVLIQFQPKNGVKDYPKMLQVIRKKLR